MLGEWEEQTSDWMHHPVGSESGIESCCELR